MAKIFRTEELSVNGDNIRLAADNNGNLVIKDSNSNVVTSTDIIASDVSSLAVKDVATSSDISSLQFKDLDLDSDISSLAAVADANDVRINNVALATTDNDSKAVTFETAFPAGVTPAVVGLMKAGSTDPIIGVQLSAVSNTGATFQFSDDIPANDTYTLVVMASA